MWMRFTAIHLSEQWLPTIKTVFVEWNPPQGCYVCTPAHYQTKKLYLTVVTSLQQCEKLQPYLPDRGKLIAATKREIDEAAEIIQNPIETSDSTDLDDIESGISGLESACSLLDCFIGNAGTASVELLRKAQMSREADREDDLEARINKLDFEGIAMQLEPLCASQDKQNNAKNERLCTLIVKVVDKCILDLERKVDDGTGVKEDIDALNTLAKMQFRLPKLQEIEARCTSAIPDIEGKVNNKFSKLLATVNACLDEGRDIKDYYKIGQQRPALDTYYSATEFCLTEDNVSNYEDVTKNVQASMTKLKERAEFFRPVNDDETSASSLAKDLTCLKQVPGADMLDCYQQTVRIFAKRMQELHSEYKDTADRLHTYRDEIKKLDCLQKCLEGGLGQHVDCPQLLPAINQSLNALNTKSYKRDLEMKEYLHNDDDWIQEAQHLSEMQRPSEMQKFASGIESFQLSLACGLGFNGDRPSRTPKPPPQYRSDVDNLNKTIDSALRDASSALGCGDYDLVLSYYSYYKQMDSFMRQHVDTELLSRHWKDLQGKLELEFRYIYSELKQSSSVSADEFETMFSKYSRFVGFLLLKLGLQVPYKEEFHIQMQKI